MSAKSEKNKLQTDGRTDKLTPIPHSTPPPPQKKKKKKKKETKRAQDR